MLIDMSLPLDTLSWFRANNYLMLLLFTACLVEKQTIQFHRLCFIQSGSEPTIYHTRCGHADLLHHWCGASQLDNIYSSMESMDLIKIREYQTANNNGESRETWTYTRRKKNITQTHHCVGHHNTQANTNNVNTTLVLLQTTI